MSATWPAEPPSDDDVGRAPSWPPAAGAVPPIVRGNAASGGFPVPPARPTGGFPAVPPARPTGGYPAVSRPSDTGPVKPVRQTGRHAQRATGSFALPPSAGPYGAASVAGSATPPAPSTGHHRAVSGLPVEGDEVDGYRILSTIGRGSMGRVYRARDPIGRDVALKVILAEQADVEGVQRFTREGQAMAAVPRHTNVVNVHSTGTARGLPYLVLDLVEGESLADVLKRGRLRVDDAVGMTTKLARAVQHVHSAGVLHRDLKPANILIRREDGEPVLSDFGMAGLRGADRLTRTGDLVGTPLYMPPEQVLGVVRKIDARSDVWALGAMLYEMLSGAPPFTGRTLVDVSRAITSNEPAPIEGVDVGLMGVVRRALAKRKDDRFETAGALADALVAWGAGQAPPPPPPPRRSRLTVGLVVAAVAGVGLGAAALAVAARRARDARDVQTAGAAPTASGGATTQPPAFVHLKPLVEQVRAGKVLQALAWLNRERDELRRALDDAERRAGEEVARAHAEALAGATPLDAEQLAATLLVIGRLRELARLPAASDPLTDVVLERLRARLEEVNAPDFDHQAVSLEHEIAVVEALGAAGLRPADANVAYGALAGFRDAYTPPGVHLDIRQYHQLLVAVVRLDIDVHHDHVARLALVPGEVSRTAHAEFLNLRISWESQDQTDSDVRRRVVADVARKTRLFLDGSRAEELGPASLARAWTMAASAAPNDRDMLAMLDRAAGLDPRTPYPLLQKAMTLFELTGRTDDEARRAELMRDALAAAIEAQTRLAHDGYDALPGTSKWQVAPMYVSLGEVFVGAGELTRARAALERAATLNPGLRDLDELRQALTAAEAKASETRD